MFDLNVLLRKNSSWDSTNARKLMDFIIFHNFYRDINFQLGNGNLNNCFFILISIFSVFRFVFFLLRAKCF